MKNINKCDFTKRGMSPDPLTGMIFTLVILLIITHPEIKVHRLRKSLKIDFAVAPLIGIFSLIMTPAAIEVIIGGIVGNETIQPYSIIILFFSLAYICVSLDETGFFEYLSLVAIKKSNGSTKRLFVYIYVLSGLVTVFTSNDIVILTITPIICYFCKHAKINPVPYLIAQFFSANIWSLTLYIGNPTNIIVAQAYSLTFTGYSAIMVLPTIGAGVTCFFLLLILFRNDLGSTMEIPPIEPKHALKSPVGAIYGITVLMTCLALLSVAPFFGWSLWAITLICAVIMAFKDVYLTLRNKSKMRDNLISQKSRINADIFHTSRKHENPVLSVLLKMPWKIVPFVIGMFILVEFMVYSGWIEIFALNLAPALNNSGVFGSILLMAYLTSLACNLMNNQPMTIFFTRILENAGGLVNPEILRAAMFALIAGSNFGANLTLIGALAGIMWMSIIRANGINAKIPFSKIGFIVMPAVIFTASLILWLEFIII